MKNNRFIIVFIAIFVAILFTFYDNVSAETKIRLCNYSDGKNTFTLALNSDNKSVTLRSASFADRCNGGLDGILIGIDYDSFEVEESGAYQGVPLCKFEIGTTKLDVNVPEIGDTSKPVCRIEFDFAKNGGNFDVTSVQIESKRNLKYCVYKVDNNGLNLVDDTTGDVSKYTTASSGSHLIIGVDVDSKSIISNNVKTALGNNATLDENFTYNTVIDSAGKCKNLVVDDIENPVIDDKTHEGSEYQGIDWNNPNNVNCEGILGNDLIKFLRKIYGWIEIIAPILVIVLSSIDFAGAILQDDKDAIKKASGKLIKRLIVVVAIVFVPIVLNFVLNIFNEITGAGADTCIVEKKD